MTNKFKEHLQNIPFIENYLTVFDDLISSLMSPDNEKMFNLKILHTFKVVEHAYNIVKSENLNDELAKISILSALFHDIGRFEQYDKYKTFSDAISENHAILGAKTLLKYNILENETKKIKNKIIAVVALHNKHLLPDSLNPTLKLCTNIVRDADKLDILNIFARELAKAEISNEIRLHVKNEPDKYSIKVLNIVLDSKIPNYPDLVYVNDFMMLLCAWKKGLNFKYSFEYFEKENFIEIFTKILPDDENIKILREYLG